MKAKAYLVQESNGVWYAKYLNAENQWTKRSLQTRKKAVARIKFGEFLTELNKAEARRVEPIKFGGARDQYLRWVEVEANKARYSTSSSGSTSRARSRPSSTMHPTSAPSLHAKSRNTRNGEKRSSEARRSTRSSPPCGSSAENW